MKLAIAGKGGVGKTTFAGTLARLFAKDGYKVIAVDADPAMNLSFALGISSDVTSKIIPLSENYDLIEERTGARPGSSGSVFSLTPNVNDIVEKYGVKGLDDIGFLVMGTVKSGGSGCMCPVNALLKALLRHLLISRKDIVILDMEAGLEHLGRGTIKGVDAIITLVEPRMQSIETTKRILKLANDLNLKSILIVANKVRNQEEEDFIHKMIEPLGVPIIGIIPYDNMISRSDMMRIAPIDLEPNSPAIKAIDDIKKRLIEKYS